MFGACGYIASFVIRQSGLGPADYKRYERFRNIAAVKIDISLGVDDKLSDQRMRHLLRVTAARIAGEHAVRIHIVDWTNERRPRPKCRQIQHRH